MKLEFNKVTWYSKLAAVILFILILPIWTFYMGMQYQETVDIFENTSTDTHSTKAVVEWKTYKSDIYDYEIKFPAKYALSKDEVPAIYNVKATEGAEYTDENYHYTFEVFARDTDFKNDCLKDLRGEDLTKTLNINNNVFYAFEDRVKGTGGRMAFVLGGMKSDYRIIHGDQCYFVSYLITPVSDNPPFPSEVIQNLSFEKLEQIFSTFKFTK